MATHKYPTNSVADQEVLRADKRELIIAIFPRTCTRWEGTAQQLVEEGLLPAEFEWPDGRRDRRWDSGEFSYWLTRSRPPGMKGPMSAWTSGDWWTLDRSLTANRGKGFAAANIFEAKRAYEKALWLQTPEGGVAWMRYWAASQDEVFQAFLRKASGSSERARHSRSRS